jgi:hypothetical protein
LQTRQTTTRCKACGSPNRDFIDESLRLGRTPKEVAEELVGLGDTLNEQNVYRHKKHVAAQVQSTERAQAIAELKNEVARVPATLAAPYFVLIQFLEQSNNQKVSASDAVKAAEAITRITGMRTKQSLMMAFAQRAFGQDAPVRGELERVDARD